MVWEPANVRKTSCTAWDPWTTHVLWLFQWARTVCERMLSGAAIVFQWGWGGTTHMQPAQPRPSFSSLAKQTVVQRQPHAISACPQITGQRLERTITAGLTSHSERNPPQFLASLACIVEAHISRLELNIEEPYVMLRNCSRPSGVGKKQKARGNEVPTDAHVTGWHSCFFPSFKYSTQEDMRHNWVDIEIKLSSSAKNAAISASKILRTTKFSRVLHDLGLHILPHCLFGLFGFHALVHGGLSLEQTDGEKKLRGLLH